MSAHMKQLGLICMLLDDRSTATVTLCQTNVRMINVMQKKGIILEECKKLKKKSQGNSQDLNRVFPIYK